MIPTVFGWALDLYAGLAGGHTRPPAPLTKLDRQEALGLTPNDGSSYAAGLDLGIGVHRPGRFGLDVPLLQLRILDLGKHRTTGRNGEGIPTTLVLDEATGALSVLGIGAHLELGHLLVRAAVRPVFEWSIASGTVTQTPASDYATASVATNNPAFAFGADAELEACGLVTPRLGLCAQVTPRLSRTIAGEHGLGNGLFFGIGVQGW